MAHNRVLWYAGTAVNQQPGTTGRAPFHGPDRLNGRVTFEKGAGLQTVFRNAVTCADRSGASCLRAYLARAGLLSEGIVQPTRDDPFAQQTF